MRAFQFVCNPGKRHPKIYVYRIFAAVLFHQFIYVVVAAYADVRWYPYKLSVEVVLACMSYVMLSVVHNRRHRFERKVSKETLRETPKLLQSPETLSILLQGGHLPAPSV